MYHKSSFDDEKDDILLELRKSKANLKLFQKCTRFGKDWRETIALEEAYFNSLVKELVEIKKRYLKEGVDDERFSGKTGC